MDNKKYENTEINQLINNWPNAELLTDEQKEFIANHIFKYNLINLNDVCINEQGQVLFSQDECQDVLNDTDAHLPINLIGYGKITFMHTENRTDEQSPVRHQMILDEFHAPGKLEDSKQQLRIDLAIKDVANSFTLSHATGIFDGKGSPDHHTCFIGYSQSGISKTPIQRFIEEQRKSEYKNDLGLLLMDGKGELENWANSETTEINPFEKLYDRNDKFPVEPFDLDESQFGIAGELIRQLLLQKIKDAELNLKPKTKKQADYKNKSYKNTATKTKPSAFLMALINKKK